MLQLANIAGWIVAHWKWALGVLLLVIVAITLYCSTRRDPKLNEAQIQAAQKAIATDDRKLKLEILAESDLAEKQIDANLANAETQKLKTLQESREKRQKMTDDELTAELERRAKP